MSQENLELYSTIGRRIAERRKKRGLSQAVVASRLSRKRTQAWVSTLETGRRNVSASDLYEIAGVLGITVGELFSESTGTTASPSASLNDLLTELSSRLPIEIAMYLQRDMGRPDMRPIDYHYTSAVPTRSVFSAAHPILQTEALNMMVVERYYREPRMDPSDLLTYNTDLMPVSDPDLRAPDRILIKVDEPVADFIVHPGVVNALGEAEIALSMQQTVVLPRNSYDILGVINVRRTLYRSSIIRTWLQRQYGIVKDERLSE